MQKMIKSGGKQNNKITGKTVSLPGKIILLIYFIRRKENINKRIKLLKRKLPF